MQIQDIPMFPVKQGLKTPAVKGWQDAATTDEAKIERWIRDGKNLGVRTGNGLMVIDIDVKGDVDGFETFNEVVNGKRFPNDTLAAETPTGGEHIYLKYDPKKYTIKNSTSKLAKGVDIRGEGGYVLAPGSETKDGQYVPSEGVEVDALIRPAPKWLLERLTAATDKGSDTNADSRPMRPDERAVLDRLPPEYYERYDLWVDTGQALKFTFGEHGYMPWVEFSKQWEGFPGEPELRAKWASFSTDVDPRNAIKFGSLVHIAKEYSDDDIDGDTTAIGEALAPRKEGSAAKFLRANTPHPRKNRLPFVETTADGGMKAVQLTNIENVEDVLKQMGLGVRLNILEKRAEFYFISDTLQAEFCELEYTQDIGLVVWSIAQRAGLRAQNDWDDATRTLAANQPWHPLDPYISDIEWDGEDHISALAETVVVADVADRKLWNAYIKRWLVQGVQAIYGVDDPQQLRGCLVLSGPQGCGKTTWFGRLVPEPKYYVEGCGLTQRGGAIDRDAVEKATRGFICELGELETTFSKAEAGALKNFLTSTVDRYRPAYGRTTIAFPRGTIFCGTVNYSEFLRDSSGSSRYWPVRIKKANSRHEIDVHQVWAQARELWLEGEPLSLTESEEKARLKRASSFEDQTPIMQLAVAYFDTYRVEKDGIIDGKQIAVNATMFCKGLGVQVPKKADLNDAAAALLALTGEVSAFHKDGKIGVQKSWLIPHSAKMQGARDA